MRQESQRTEFIDLVVRAAAGCAAVVGIGLFVPDLRPLALKLGTGIFFGVAATCVGVLAYIGWRLLSHPYRKRRPLLPGQFATSIQLPPKSDFPRSGVVFTRTA